MNRLRCLWTPRGIAGTALLVLTTVLVGPSPAGANNENTLSVRNCSGAPIDVRVFNGSDSGMAIPASGYQQQAHAQTVGFKCYRVWPNFETYCRVEIQNREQDATARGVYRVDNGRDECFRQQ